MTKFFYLCLALIICSVSETAFSLADNDADLSTAINEESADKASETSGADKSSKDEFFIPPIIIDNFDVGRTDGIFIERTTTLGTYQGTWAKRPAWSIITKSEEHRMGDTGYGLRLEWKNLGGWCGWYTLLDGLDVTDYNALTFWIKGEEGGERFDIGLADMQMQNLDISAKYVGAVSFFLDNGVTKEWQKVKIPLSRLGADVDLSALGSLVFWCRYSSAGDSSVVYIDDLMIENDPDVRKIEEYNAPRAEFDPDHPRTMWVWKIDPVVNLKAREDMFDLSLRTAIRTCYVYFGDFDEHDDPNYTKQLEEFLRESHEKGIKIEILTGNPTWAMKENHHLAYNWMKAFLEYNKSRPPELRVDGCSFDVEPYLAGEWNTRREEVKAEYLVLLASIRELIDSYPDQHFELGGAIPTFYKDEGDFEEKMLGYLDYAALMAYHDSSRKIIDSSRFHIDLAERLGKKIYIGVETQDLVTMNQGTRATTFYEEGWEDMEAKLKEVEDAFRGNKAYGGLAMHCYYSYKLLQRGRNTPYKLRVKPEELNQFISRFQQGTVEIDGDLGDWIKTDPVVLNQKRQVVFGPGAWNGPEDYSITAYSMWDLYNLYLAFVVVDNVLVQEKVKQEMWEGDHIEFWLDVDLLGDYNEAMNSDDDFQFGFAPGNFNNIEPEVFLFIPEYPEHFVLDNTEIAAKRTDDGYIIEVRIDARMFRDIDFKKVRQTASEDKQNLVANREIYEKGPDAVSEGSGRFIFADDTRLGYSLDGSDCDDANAPQKLLISTSKDRIWGDPTTFNAIWLKK